VKVAGAADYVTTAGEASNAREALFFVESAAMLQHEHARAPVRASCRIHTRWWPWAPVVVRARRRRSTGSPGPPRRTPRLREMSDRTRKELGATRLDLALTGRPSDLARRELKQLGWVVVPPAMLKE
jgi:hypothetical protein